MLEKLYGRFVGGRSAFGILLLRAGFGAGLMVHGWPKIQTPTSWAGDTLPGMLQALAALGEFGGGLALLLGLLMPLGALGVLFTMLGAWWFQHRTDPWINPGNSSYELASLYGVLALALFFIGPGCYSLDYLLWGRRRKQDESTQ